MTSFDPTQSLAWLRERGHARIDAAVILGSGLQSFAEEIGAGDTIVSSEIPGYPRSSTPGHEGLLTFCSIHGREVLVFRGRVHGYEGYDAMTTAASATLAIELGATLLLVTNAAGGVNPALDTGDLMLNTDFLVAPLAFRMGAGLQELPRGLHLERGHVPHLSAETIREAHACATGAGIRLHAGTYGYASGPSYETRAEIAMLRRIGVDAIGMSTVPEILVARSRGVRVLPISCITNKAQTVATVTSHSDVTRVAGLAEERLTQLLRALLGCA